MPFSSSGRGSVVELVPLALAPGAPVLFLLLSLGIVIVLTKDVSLGGPVFTSSRLWNGRFSLVMLFSVVDDCSVEAEGECEKG